MLEHEKDLFLLYQNAISFFGLLYPFLSDMSWGW